MTTFWLVHRQRSSRETDVLKATPVSNILEENNKLDERHTRRPRKNHATHAINGGHQKSHYTSQIGLIYLKPTVRYSTSVYFHSNNDFYEDPRSAEDNRYDEAIVFLVNLLYRFTFSLKDDRKIQPCVRLSDIYF